MIFVIPGWASLTRLDVMVRWTASNALKHGSLSVDVCETATDTDRWSHDLESRIIRGIHHHRTIVWSSDHMHRIMSHAPHRPYVCKPTDLFVQTWTASDHMHRNASVVIRLIFFVQARTASDHMHHIASHASHRTICVGLQTDRSSCRTIWTASHHITCTASHRFVIILIGPYGPSHRTDFDAPFNTGDATRWKLWFLHTIIWSSCYDALGWFFWDATIFCNNFARWLQKIVACYDALDWFFWDATIFCNNFARWLQKIVACDVLVFWDATIFCNNFARRLQKLVATLRCSMLGFLACYDLL